VESYRKNEKKKNIFLRGFAILPQVAVKAIGQQKSAVKADRTHLLVQSDFVRRLAVSSE
jgi:hypothetical protein